MKCPSCNRDMIETNIKGQYWCNDCKRGLDDLVYREPVNEISINKHLHTSKVIKHFYMGYNPATNECTMTLHFNDGTEETFNMESEIFYYFTNTYHIMGV